MHAHQVPAAAEFFAVERERQVTLGESLMRIALWLPAPAIPDHYRAAAILAFGDRALEFVIGDRVILDLHRQPLVAGHQAGATRDRPAFHDAIELESKIVV